MTKKKASIIIALSLFTVFVTQVNLLRGQAQITAQETRENIIRAFDAVAQAQDSGGNITKLASDLNIAIELMEEGKLEDANQLANRILEEAKVAREAGVRTNTWNLVRSGLVVTALLAISVLVWIYGSNVFWDTWIRLRKEWIIRVD